MNKSHIKWRCIAVVSLAVFVLGLAGLMPGSNSRLDAFDSPIVTPAPGSTPMPFPAETEKALRYIVEREGVSAERLLVVNQHRREYEWLGRTFWAVTALDMKNDRWYHAMVDLADGHFVDDLEAMDQAEREAHRARYGKLEPALFERLETMGPEEEIQVAIWVVGVPQQSQAELYAALAARYPEAQAALDRSGNPFDVGDYELTNEIEAEYVRMVEVGTQVRVQPVVQYLEGQGYKATTFGALPSVAVTLPKSAILELVRRADVGAVYLSGRQQQPALDSATPSDRVPIVWQRSFKGGNALIAAAVLWGLALPLIYVSWRMGKLAKKRLLWVVVAAAATLTLSVLYLVACQPHATESPSVAELPLLPFETIERAEVPDTGQYYQGQNPKLVVITEVREGNAVGNIISIKAQAQLQNLDFNRYFAAVVFQGIVGYVHPGIMIQRISVEGNVITFYVHVLEPVSNERKTMITSPYHLVKVRREEEVQGEMEFVLNVDGAVVSRQTRSLP
jgi:hypothetical protein